MSDLFAPPDGTVVEVDGTRYRHKTDGGLQRWRPIPPGRTYRNSGPARRFAAALDRIAQLEAQINQQEQQEQVPYGRQEQDRMD